MYIHRGPPRRGLDRLLRRVREALRQVIDDIEVGDIKVAVGRGTRLRAKLRSRLTGVMMKVDDERKNMYTARDLQHWISLRRSHHLHSLHGAAQRRDAQGIRALHAEGAFQRLPSRTSQRSLLTTASLKSENEMHQGHGDQERMFARR